MFAFSGPVLAQGSYQIESDELEIFNQEGRAEFTGNVRVWNDTNEIQSNRLEVFYQEGGDSIDILKAYGDVEIFRGDIYARSEFALHDVQNDTAMLQENAYIRRQQNEFWADRIWINLRTEHVRLEGNVQGEMIRAPADTAPQ